MDAAHDHRRTLELCLSQYAITGHAVATADTDADDVPALENRGIELFTRSIHHCRVPNEIRRSGLSQHVKPAGGDKTVSHRSERRIDQYNFCHSSPYRNMQGGGLSSRSLQKNPASTYRVWP